MTEQAFPDFSRLAEELQQMAVENMLAIYTPQVVEEWQRPQNVGRMSQPDASAVGHGQGGETIEFCLRVADGRIADITFMTDGCGPSIACGSKLTAMVKGRPLDQGLQITAAELLQALGGLPEEEAYCAELAVSTLREAVSGYARGRGQVSSATAQHPAAETATREEVSRRTGELMRGGHH